MKKNVFLLSFVLWIAFPAALAQEPVDLDMINRIRSEGLHRSEVMETAGYLTNVIGPRLTGSPALKKAHEWTREKLSEWGLEDAHLESWEFGRGWSFSHASVHMLSPRRTPLLALPKAWTPGTEGTVKGAAMVVRIESEADLDKYRGKLAGKVLFLDQLREVTERDELFFQRYPDQELAELSKFNIRPERRWGDWRQRMIERRKLEKVFNQFLLDEGVVALVEVSSRDNGLVRVGGGGSREVGGNPGVPALVMATEHYNWIVRLVEEHDQAVELELNIGAEFHDQDTKGYNTLAELPGTTKADEIVLIGGHLDSWHAGTGATDNAAGCAVAMEAIRILQALDVRPLRTVRIGLWGGEEQGFLGSMDYVQEHLASRAEPEGSNPDNLPSYLRGEEGPLNLKENHEKFSVYFNLDNGGGKIRGIYAQENVAAVPIFEAWLRPFQDLGAGTVTTRNTSGTDHLPFDRVGLPGFQFIQDELDYSSRTHHTNMDVYDHLRREDLIQAAIIMASFAYHAAMRPEQMPRKPLPAQAVD